MREEEGMSDHGEEEEGTGMLDRKEDGARGEDRQGNS